MIGLSFLSMYWLMYAMVDAPRNVVSNWNQVYMAGLMAAPMLILELILMGKMYQRRRLNVALIAVGALALGAFWFLIRQQAAISDRQLLRSMIPHHAGAILMCEQASLEDAEVRELCRGILEAQEREIAFMRDKLAVLP
jgi:uncharacterized protein (DUF305 family)